MNPLKNPYKDSKLAYNLSIISVEKYFDDDGKVKLVAFCVACFLIY